jgi:RHS repeat-associated protein
MEETRFVRDTNFNVLQERDSSNNVTRAYIWDEISPGSIGGLLELTQGGAQYDYLYDGKGNVSALIDANQNIVESYSYDSFGKLLSKSGTVDQPYMFSTKPYYEGYGKSYYGYRFYDPISGKWMSRDPKEEKADINLYRAMSNSAINYTDPNGEYGIALPIVVIGTLAMLYAYYKTFWADNVHIPQHDCTNCHMPPNQPEIHAPHKPCIYNCGTFHQNGCHTVNDPDLEIPKLR